MDFEISLISTHNYFSETWSNQGVLKCYKNFLCYQYIVMNMSSEVS